MSCSRRQCRKTIVLALIYWGLSHKQPVLTPPSWIASYSVGWLGNKMTLLDRLCPYQMINKLDCRFTLYNFLCNIDHNFKYIVYWEKSEVGMRFLRLMIKCKAIYNNYTNKYIKIFTFQDTAHKQMTLALLCSYLFICLCSMQ